MTTLQPLRAWRAARARRAETLAVPDAEIAAWGLSREEFRAVALMPEEQVRRMEAMALVHGVTPERLGAVPAARIQVAVACAGCRHNRPCREALSHRAQPAEMGFCPNHETFGALARRPL